MTGRRGGLSKGEISMSKKPLALLAAIACAGFVTACGDGESASSSAGSSMSSTTEKMTTQTPAGNPTETGAATLRAGLTALLQEHVYLAGIAVSQGVGEGLDSGAFKASAATLDENSKGLADAIGGVYGDDAGKQFLALWRAHIGMFVDYTKGKATGDEKVIAEAREDLDGYRAEFGAFLESANPNLTADAVAEELKPHVKSLVGAIDSVVAGRGDAFDRLQVAAGHMPNTAGVLAGAIAKQKPEMFDGDTGSGASELRSGLTALLNEHVYLAGIAITQGVGEGLDSKQFKAAAATLDDNSKGLADAIGGVYGDDAGKQFLALWRAHIGFFVNYTKAKATKDEAGAERAQTDLDGYRKEFGAFLESANPNLTADAVAEELTPHVASVITTIDSLIAGDGEVFDKLKAAASHMPDTANVLAGAIAKQMPDKFGA
jgi:cytochrome c556